MAVGPGAPNAADHNAVDGRATSTKDCESYPPMRNETRCATCNQFAPSLLSRPLFLSFCGTVVQAVAINRCRVALEEFYAPHNARFYKLLGKDYGW